MKRLGGVLRRAARRGARYLGAVFGRSGFEREMDEEMRIHLEMEVEDRIRAGMEPAEARRTALRDFGGVDRFKEEARAARGLGLLDQLVQDLRFGWRVLQRRPGFSLVAVLTLAVGLGATTAVFSLADAALLRPPPGVDDPDGLVQVRLRAPHLEDQETGISVLNLQDLQEMSLPAARRVVGWQLSSYQVAVPGRSTTILNGHAALGDYFGALGVRPAAGRLFAASETGLAEAEAVVVLSRQAVNQLFGVGHDVVGQGISINGVPVTVAGVAGEGFRGMAPGGGADLWVPYGLHARLRRIPPDAYANRQSAHLHNLLVRLAEGATPRAAQEQLRQAVDRLAEAHPEENAHFADYRPTVYETVGISPWRADRARLSLGILGAAALLVLLVACANVANLLIFRGVRRQGESAVRRAMGASGGRLLRQHLTESGLLAGAGALVGLAGPLAVGWLLRDARASGPIPLGELVLDGRVAAFAAAIGVLAVIAAGLVPAWVVHRVDLVDSLKESHRTETGRKKRLRTGLTVVQLALSLTLLVGALLLSRTVRNLHDVSLGFDAEGVVEVRINPQPQGYDEAAADRFYRALLEEAATVPGVESVAAAGAAPLRAVMQVDLRTGDAIAEEWPVQAFADYVTPDYFRALGVAVIRGRAFTEGDLAASWEDASGVAVINRTLARRLFGDDDPLGRTVVQRGYRENTTVRVVGVVADSRARGLAGPMHPALYRPFGENYTSGITLLVRSSRAPAETLAGIRGVVDGLDPALPFYRARSLQETVLEEIVEERLLARLMTVLAALAALLAGVGLYGVVAYSVAERTREIGIRMAMGAGRRTVVGMVVRQSLVLAGVGLVVGAGVAWLFARALESRLFGVEPLDPATWLVALAAFLGLAFVAAIAPARAASRVEPMTTLKTT